MQKQANPSRAARIRRYRTAQAHRGLRRIELSVPAPDAPVLQEIAAALRAGGEQAEQVREKIRDAAPPHTEQTEAMTGRTGKDLIAFFRVPALLGVELDLERDMSEGRTIVFE